MGQDEDWGKNVIDEYINYSMTIDEKIYGFK
jgi:hypothetical protein